MTRPSSDEGSAVVELVLLVVVLIVPFVYVLLAVSEVQRAAFGAAGASREAGRHFVTAPDAQTGAERAERAATLALGDQGTGESMTLDISCSTSPCLQPGGRVTTVVTVRVPLPLVPAVGGVPPRVRVSARHVEVVDSLVGRRP